jgi:alkanesulfonate monooxygenase SsuD/methylene tetrahydromethanopterin reductase-like flavin-dependent oxidoreductase (luciferase family)
MKVDGGINAELSQTAASARDAEAAGYDGAWVAETNHDPFMPMAVAAEHTEGLELGTGIAVAFARNPMNLANVADDLQRFSEGRFILGSAARSSRTSRSASRWSGRTRRPGCASWCRPCTPSGTPGRTGPRSTSGATSTPTP